MGGPPSPASRIRRPTSGNAAKITTSGDDSEGLHAVAFASGYDAWAQAYVRNWGVISTTGSNSAGIEAFAKATGDAAAIAIVDNYNNITTKGSKSPGIHAASNAYGLLNASAQTTVFNTGDITTSGSKSAGIVADATALALNGNSTAYVNVVNWGKITTSGSRSAGVLLSASGATAGITLTNHNGIYALGKKYHAIVADAHGADTWITINNNADGGLIQGNLQLSSKYSVLNNAGKWKMKGDSNFGPGTHDTVNNSGVVSMINLATIVTVTTNAGSISNVGNVSVSTVGGSNSSSNSNSGSISPDQSGGISNTNSGTLTTTNSGSITQDNSGTVNQNQNVTNNITVTNNISYSGTPRVTTVTSYVDGAAPGAGYYAFGSVLPHKVKNPSGQFHTVFIDGLETWNNNGGLITMKDGYANQQIVLGPHTNFNGTGNSRLEVDAFLGGPGSRADILVIGGNVTGTTHVGGE